MAGRTVSDGRGADGHEIQRQPLAAVFLGHYLDNRQRDSTFNFDPPDYLRHASQVTAQLQYHRAVFLTQQKARLSNREVWAGVLPRIQGQSGFQRWDLQRSVEMSYESLVEVGSGIVDIGRIQMRGTNQERDLFTSLRGFQLRSRVTVAGNRLPTGRVRITFQAWNSRVRDTYDFDFSEHLTLPNPDYGSRSPDAVRPQDQTLVVYHTNAQRLEQANLAAPYIIESAEWQVTDAQVVAPGEVDPSRRL
jgi:hypothetical protein